jgi:hypothetical protein
MEQTTDPISTNDRPDSYRVIPCPVDQDIAEALMIPFAMIVRHVLQDRPAERSRVAPSGTIRSKHSLLIESTNRSAKALRFGLLAGNLTTFTPPCPQIRRNASV